MSTSTDFGDNPYGIDRTEPRANSVLDLWTNRNGFFSEAYFMHAFKEHFEANDVGHEGADPRIQLFGTKLTTYICGADGLSTTERDLIVANAYIWNGYHVTIKQLNDAVDEGLAMSDGDVTYYLDEMSRLYGSNIDEKFYLYYALTLAGTDEVSSSEERTLKRIAATMNVDSETVDKVIDSYLSEVVFGNKISELFSNSGSEQQSLPYGSYNNYSPSSFYEPADYSNHMMVIVGLLILLLVSICINIYNHFVVRKISGFKGKSKAKFSKLEMINEDTDF